jgi:hypothetical protein
MHNTRHREPFIARQERRITTTEPVTVVVGCPEAQDTDRSREAPTPVLEAHLSISVSVGSYQWSGVGLTVRDKNTGKPKRLLQGCAGTALPGDLVALIGPSGTIYSTIC